MELINANLYIDRFIKSNNIQTIIIPSKVDQNHLIQFISKFLNLIILHLKNAKLDQ